MMHSRLFAVASSIVSFVFGINAAAGQGSPTFYDGWPAPLEAFGLPYVGFQPARVAQFVFEINVDGGTPQESISGPLLTTEAFLSLDGNATYYEIVAVNELDEVVGGGYPFVLDGKHYVRVKIWGEQTVASGWYDFNGNFSSEEPEEGGYSYFNGSIGLGDGELFALVYHRWKSEFEVSDFSTEHHYSYVHREANGNPFIHQWWDTNGGLLPGNPDIVDFSSPVYAPECGNTAACNYQYGGADEDACVFAESYRNCEGACFHDADGDGVCDEEEQYVCFDDEACNYAPLGDDFTGTEEEDNDTCLFEDAAGECGGNCELDADGDGICDDDGNDTCFGVIDACGVCNGPGLAEGCDCSGPPAGFCDCQGSVEDAAGVCGGDCTSDSDGDGICDDEDTCIGVFDECGVCNGNGPGDCGCENIPEGACDCEGTLPVHGRDCGGNCLSDINDNGVCDADEGITFGTEVPHARVSTKVFDRVKPLTLRESVDSIKYMHRRMVEHLEYGSITGTSRVLVVEDSLSSKGVLEVDFRANLMGELNVHGRTRMDSVLRVQTDAPTAAYFQGDEHGIEVIINRNDPGHANNFVTFRNAGGNVMGRIEAERLSELDQNNDYQNTLADYDDAISDAEWGVGVATTSAVLGAFDIAMAVGDLVAASSSVTPCVGFGFCVTAPIPSLIVQAGITLGLAIANEIVLSLDVAAAGLSLDRAEDAKERFESAYAGDIGVTYASGNGDYAEWIPKADPNERMLPGQIIGVRNGEVSLNTDSADHLFVVSNHPIVLGNERPGKPGESEKAAFLGQVPARIQGPVRSGDFILPNGRHNGHGIARAPEDLTLQDLTQVVGRAWESGTNEVLNIVNVAVGLNDVSSALAHVVSNELKRMMSGEYPTSQPAQNPNELVFIGDSADFEMVVPDAESVIIKPLDPADVDLALDEAYLKVKEMEMPERAAEVWQRIHDEPEFRARVAEELTTLFDEHNRWVYETLKERKASESASPAPSGAPVAPSKQR